MSVMRRILNPYLRLTEKRRLARARNPQVLRRALERNARLFFWPPRNSTFHEEPVGGRPATWVNQGKTGPLVLYLHGGGYVFGSPRTHRAMLAQLSMRAGVPAVLPDYRLAPEHVFPGAVEDAISAYRDVMRRPGGVILGGDSAGGGLALALLQEILAQDLPKPLGVFAIAPLTDMTFSGESTRSNANSDVVLPAARAIDTAAMYLHGAAPRDPRASPLFAGFSGAPPVWIAVSDSEILLDDTIRMCKRLRYQGVDVTEVIEPGLSHVWPILHNFLPEARATLDDLAGWISNLSPPSSGS